MNTNELTHELHQGIDKLESVSEELKKLGKTELGVEIEEMTERLGGIIEELVTPDPMSIDDAVLSYLVINYKGVSGERYLTKTRLQHLVYILSKSSGILNFTFKKQSDDDTSWMYSADLDAKIRDMFNNRILCTCETRRLDTEYSGLAFNSIDKTPVEQTIKNHPAIKKTLDNLLNLTDGFNSEYGLRLLAIVYEVFTHDWAKAGHVALECPFMIEDVEDAFNQLKKYGYTDLEWETR